MSLSQCAVPYPHDYALAICKSAAVLTSRTALWHFDACGMSLSLSIDLSIFHGTSATALLQPCFKQICAVQHALNRTSVTQQQAKVTSQIAQRCMHKQDYALFLRYDRIHVRPT